MDSPIYEDHAHCRALAILEAQDRYEEKRAARRRQERHERTDS
jgi:hypothetical protein